MPTSGSHPPSAQAGPTRKFPLPRNDGAVAHWTAPDGAQWTKLRLRCRSSYSDIWVPEACRSDDSIDWQHVSKPAGLPPIPACEGLFFQTLDTAPSSPTTICLYIIFTRMALRYISDFDKMLNQRDEEARSKGQGPELEDEWERRAEGMRSKGKLPRSNKREWVERKVDERRTKWYSLPVSTAADASPPANWYTSRYIASETDAMNLVDSDLVALSRALDSLGEEGRHAALVSDLDHSGSIPRYRAIPGEDSSILRAIDHMVWASGDLGQWVANDMSAGWNGGEKFREIVRVVVIAQKIAMGFRAADIGLIRLFTDKNGNEAPLSHFFAFAMSLVEAAHTVRQRWSPRTATLEVPAVSTPWTPFFAASNHHAFAASEQSRLAALMKRAPRALYRQGKPVVILQDAIGLIERYGKEALKPTTQGGARTSLLCIRMMLASVVEEDQPQEHAARSWSQGLRFKLWFQGRAHLAIAERLIQPAPLPPRLRDWFSFVTDTFVMASISSRPILPHLMCSLASLEVAVDLASTPQEWDGYLTLQLALADAIPTTEAMHVAVVASCHTKLARMTHEDSINEAVRASMNTCAVRGCNASLQMPPALVALIDRVGEEQGLDMVAARQQIGVAAHYPRAGSAIHQVYRSVVGHVDVFPCPSTIHVQRPDAATHIALESISELLHSLCRGSKGLGLGFTGRVDVVGEQREVGEASGSGAGGSSEAGKGAAASTGQTSRAEKRKSGSGQIDRKGKGRAVD